MATLEDQYRLMTDKDPLALPQMDGPITPDLRRYGMPPPGTGGGAPYTPQAPYIPPYAYDMQQNRFVPMTANREQPSPQFRATATRLGPDEPRPQFRATPPRPGPYIENIQGGAAQERQGYSTARRNDVSPRFGAWLTGTDVENANPNQISSLRSFYGPASQQEISLPSLRGTGPRTQFQVTPERMPPMRGANGLPVGYSPTPEEQARAEARRIAEQTSGVNKITGGVTRRTDAFGFGPRTPAYQTSGPFSALGAPASQRPSQGVVTQSAPMAQAGQPSPRQAAPRGTGIFYSRSGVEGTQQQYVPGTLGEVTPEQRVQMAMQRFAPEVAIGPNGQRMQLPTDREVGPYSPESIANQQAIRRSAEGMAAGMFQTRGAESAARRAEQELQIKNELRNFRGTNRERAAYERELRSLQGPQEQERRKQERAAERIAKASNPPQIVRGEKSEEDKALEDARETAIKRYTGEDFNFTGKTKRALESVIASATAEQLDLLTSLIGSTDQSQEGVARRSKLYQGFAKKYGTDVARELFSLPNAPSKGVEQ